MVTAETKRVLASARGQWLAAATPEARSAGRAAMKVAEAAEYAEIEAVMLPPVDVDVLETWLVAEAAAGREFDREAGPVVPFVREALGVQEAFGALTYYQYYHRTVAYPKAVEILEKTNREAAVRAGLDRAYGVNTPPSRKVGAAVYLRQLRDIRQRA